MWNVESVQDHIAHDLPLARLFDIELLTAGRTANHRRDLSVLMLRLMQQSINDKTPKNDGARHCRRATDAEAQTLLL